MAARRAQRWTASARIAAKSLFARLRQIVFTEPDSGPDQATQVSARELAREAGRLRGGVAKVAQLAGYLDAFDLEPDARGALASLWDHIPAQTGDAVAAVIVAELGRPPRELFARFDDQPLASASLGQVHAAEDADGRAWAVKVQYPEVAEALREDVSGRGLVRQLAGSGLGSQLSSAAIETLRAAVLGELDYAAEAEAAARFARAFAGDPSITVPAVDRARSSSRVLCMERARGLSIRGASGAPEPVRTAAAEAIWRFAWEGPLRHGLIHGDPNPGNYLVADHADRIAVAFLDYGCTAALDAPLRERERQLWRSLLQRDPFSAAERFRHAVAAHRLLTDARAFHGDAYRDWERLVTAPVLAEQPFAWTAAHAAELLAATRRLSASGALTLAPELVLLWRQRLGVAAVLGMLDARMDVRAALAAALG